MNTNEINYLLSNIKCFIGTFPRDMLPNNKKYKKPIALIFNSDQASKPGKHWIALIVNKNKTAEYFDSFGMKPIHEDVLKFLAINNVNKIIYNSKQLQSVTTSTCGAYCVLFVKFRCSGLKFCDVINYFTNNKINNDLKAMLSLIL